jgi:hypothetical protein
VDDDGTPLSLSDWSTSISFRMVVAARLIWPIHSILAVYSPADEVEEAAQNSLTQCRHATEFNPRSRDGSAVQFRRVRAKSRGGEAGVIDRELERCEFDARRGDIA